MLDGDALRERLMRPTVLAVDTSAVFRRALLGLADRVNQLNDRRGDGSLLSLVIPALVHAGHLFQERRGFGPHYDPGRPMQVLKDKGVKVLAFEEDDAARHGALLAAHHPTDAAWNEAKRLALGVGPGALRMPATADWFIASHAAGRGWLFVTTDGGVDVSWIDDRTTPAALIAALDDLLA